MWVVREILLERPRPLPGRALRRSITYEPCESALTPLPGSASALYSDVRPRGIAQNWVTRTHMNPPIQASTAHHEAGHAVVAHHLGARVEKIVLDASNPNEGGAVIIVKDLSLETRLVISLAGPLAEAKFEAGKASKCEVRFDLTRIETILSVAYEDHFLEEVDPVIHFQVDGSGSIPFSPTDLNLFSDLQSLCETGALKEIDQQQFGQLICRTMSCLDLKQA
jgi:hypothetical protein